MKKNFDSIVEKINKNKPYISLFLVSIIFALVLAYIVETINTKYLELKMQLDENNERINQLIDQFETSAPASVPEAAAPAEPAAPAEAALAGDTKRAALLREFPELAPILNRLEKAMRIGGEGGAEFIKHHLFLHSPDPKDRVEEEPRLLVLEYQLCGLADHPGNGIESFDLSKDLGHRSNALPALAVLQAEGWIVINKDDRPQWTGEGYLHMMMIIDWYITNY